MVLHGYVGSPHTLGKCIHLWHLASVCMPAMWIWGRKTQQFYIFIGIRLFCSNSKRLFSRARNPSATKLVTWNTDVYCCVESPHTQRKGFHSWNEGLETRNIPIFYVLCDSCFSAPIRSVFEQRVWSLFLEGFVESRVSTGLIWLWRQRKRQINWWREVRSVMVALSYHILYSSVCMAAMWNWRRNNFWACLGFHLLCSNSKCNWTWGLMYGTEQ